MTASETPEETAEQLAAKSAAGCLASFERLVELHQDRIYSYVLQILRNEQDAADVAQESFIKAYRNLGSFNGRARFLAWLYTIAKNSALTHLRKRRHQVPLDDVRETLAEPAPAFEPGEREAIWTIARTLKPKFYEILWLFYAEGFSLNEIAGIMKTNPVTVRVNLHRARAALGRALVAEAKHH